MELLANKITKKDCTTTTALRNPPTTAHIETCQTICTPCQLRRSFRPSLYPAFFPTNNKTCSHRPANGTTVFVSVFATDSSPRDLCSTCAAEGTEKLLERRAEIEAIEMENQESGRVVCALCRRQMGVGPRWWICGVCGVSCDSGLHVAWVGRKNK
jgi:hypothetical protein